MAKSYRELLVWKKGIELTVLVYQLTKGFPREELYGLTSQMRRAAVSKPANIAEGSGRLGTPEYRHFLGIARASNCELQTLRTIANQLQPIDTEQIRQAESRSDEAGKTIPATLNALAESRQLRVASRSSIPATVSHSPLTTSHFER